VLFLLLYQSTACSGVYEWSVPKINCITSNADRSDSRFSFVMYQSTAYWSGAYPKFIIYHPTPIDSACFLFLLYQSTAYWSGAYPKFIIYHPTPIDSTCFFFCYINQLPVVECTSGAYPKLIVYHPTPIRATHAFLLLYINQLHTGVEHTHNLLYIIQCRLERLTLFFCYISINCLLEWSVPKIYYISSNADRLVVLFLLLYHSTACSGVYPKFIIYHPTPIGATRAFCLLYINQLPTGMERTQNLLPRPCWYRLYTSLLHCLHQIQ
jgi:hypothetical protein